MESILTREWTQHQESRDGSNRMMEIEATHLDHKDGKEGKLKSRDAIFRVLEWCKPTCIMYGMQVWVHEY